MINTNLINDADIKELKDGFIFNQKSGEYKCLFCSKTFQDGVVYPKDDLLTEARMAIKLHIVEAHESSFIALTQMEKPSNGLSTIQQEILPLLYEGLPDTKIAQQLGNKAKSTIRNHRFIMREKYKEAKIYMAIMEKLLEKNNRPEDDFVKFHASLTVHDDRTRITQKEKKDIIKRYFDGNKLMNFPKKQKRKLILLQHIASMLDVEKKYSDKEMNEFLMAIFEDHVTIRRYLIEYGFVARKKDGSEYWVLD